MIARSEKVLSEKVIVIVGGAGLLGKQLVRAVVNEGGKVVLADVDENVAIKELGNIKNELKTENVLFVKLDITSKESVSSMIETVSSKYGKIDAVVNSAYPRNKNYGREFKDVTYEDFCENTNTHLGGYFLVSQQSAEFFKKQGFGNVINFSSIYGVIPPRFEIYDGVKMTMPVEYAAIKSAIVHLTKYMAKYFKGSNVRFNCISPGGIYDDQPETFVAEYKKNSMSKGMLTTEDITGTLIYLLSDMSKYVNGQNVIVDDGFCL